MADHAAVTSLLEQVTGVIKGYSDLISGAEKEFERLKDDVVELKAILKDMANISSEDLAARLIKNQIREVVYEVEDAIDSWLTETNAKSRLTRGLTNLNLAKKVKSLRENEVKEMLEKASEMKRALASQGSSKEEDVQERRTVHDSQFKKGNVVDLKDEEEKITGYLRQDLPELDIIPIIGMPGLGKTTLTWKIYNDEKIRYEFPIRIWVQFTQRFSSRDVLIQIMKHFTDNLDELHSKSERELCDSIHACLSRDKFLLVVDDVWIGEHWDAIKGALPYSNGNGKVMITSRELMVGRHVQQITEPHQQRRLNPYESWELLQLEIFGKVGVCPDALKGVGNAIVEICRGIPITIMVLGGILKDLYLSLNSDALVREKWYEVAENCNLALEDLKQVIVNVVRLSYYRLPERLRDCFLYLGVFPAGYAVQTWTLIRLWIAEGFIQPDGNRSLEKIAEDNLYDLISRNLLIVQNMNPMGEVKVCVVHNVIRMFCADEAVKQNLFNEVRMPEGDHSDLATEMEKIRLHSDLASEMEKIHRLCLHSDIEKFFSEDLQGPRVRSFLCFLKDAMELDPGYISAIPRNFPSLRILQSKSIKFNQFPQRVTKLNHLRYLVLCVADLKILPEPLSQLWNLQTIIVDTNSDSLKMRVNLWKMMRLRHVKTKSAIVLDKTWEGEAGDNLQTLNRLSPESVTEAISRKANDLKTLGVRGNLSTLFEDMPLGNMNHLEKLKLYNEEVSENRLPHFPGSNRFPPNLKRLTLSNTFLEWKHMSTIAMIPGLEVLKLKDNAFTGISWEAESYTFRKLQYLLILFTDLVIWTASTSTFPCLKHLELKNCEDLNTIPDCVLQRLESLDIGRVHKSIAESAKNLAIQLKLGAELI